MQTTAQASWHTAQWGTWGWLETIAKGIALAAAFIALFTTALTHFTLRDNPHLAAFILLTLLSLGAVMQLVIRLKQRETISVAFAIFNLLGHAALLVAMAQVSYDRLWPVLFGIFYTLGSLIKIQFLRVTGYTEFEATPAAMLGTSGAVLVLYALFTVLLLVT